MMAHGFVLMQVKLYTYIIIHTHIIYIYHFISYYHIMLLLYITDITVSSIQYSPTLSKAFLPVLQTMLERWEGAYAWMVGMWRVVDGKNYKWIALGLNNKCWQGQNVRWKKVDIFPQVKAFACKLLRGYLYCPAMSCISPKILHVPLPLMPSLLWRRRVARSFVYWGESSLNPK